jgi:hypothetical protein
MEGSKVNMVSQAGQEVVAGEVVLTSLRKLKLKVVI